jgi:hypothetical protein
LTGCVASAGGGDSDSPTDQIGVGGSRSEGRAGHLDELRVYPIGESGEIPGDVRGVSFIRVVDVASSEGQEGLPRGRGGKIERRGRTCIVFSGAHGATSGFRCLHRSVGRR